MQCLNLNAGTPAYSAKRSTRSGAGYTIAEVLIALVIVSISLSGIMGVYIQAAIHSEWSALSLSAQQMALSGLEQCRVAKYDPMGSPPTDLLVSTNFPMRVDILDTSSSSAAVTFGTNYTTITSISTNPVIKYVQVDCVWSIPRRGIYTNTVCTYRAPNQ
jgi:Tfp pilus assembly protein PilV